MEPLNKFILIMPHANEEKRGAIYLPINQNLNYKRGTVLCTSKSIDQVAAGDTVLYYKRAIASENVTVDGKDGYDLIREDGLMLKQ